MNQYYLVPEDGLQQLLEKLNSIEANIKTQQESALAEIWLDNEQLMNLLKVSKRTLQNWRDQGLIGFSQIGSKIYYKWKDVDAFLEQHINRPFNVSYRG